MCVKLRSWQQFHFYVNENKDLNCVVDLTLRHLLNNSSNNNNAVFNFHNLDCVEMFDCIVDYIYCEQRLCQIIVIIVSIMTVPRGVFKWESSFGRSKWKKTFEFFYINFNVEGQLKLQEMQAKTKDRNKCQMNQGIDDRRFLCRIMMRKVSVWVGFR